MWHTFKKLVPLLRFLSFTDALVKLPADFKDFVTSLGGPKAVGGPFMVHCHREMVHAQWKAILDDEFMEAYEHGVVLSCPDGLKRRFYLRIFTYSADYPEK